MSRKKSDWDASITDDAPSAPDDVQKLYDDFSAQYDDAVAAWGYQAPSVAASYLGRYVNTDDPVLDAGCGTGLTGRALKARGFSQITGTDLSPDSLELARSAGCYQALHALDLNQPLPFADEAFAGIVCAGVFSYIADTVPVLKEFQRVLTPSGTLVFTQREDHFRRDDSATRFNTLHVDGGFDRVVETEPRPYLPGNPSFAEDIGVHYFVWRKRSR